MNKLLLLLFTPILLSMQPVFAQYETDFQIKTKMIMVSSAQFSPYREIQFSNCNFDLVENGQADSVYLSTIDTNFYTPEGFHVGTDWRQLDDAQRSNLSYMPGWGYYIPLPSGWQLGFCEGQTCTDLPPVDGSAVDWIFRRNR